MKNSYQYLMVLGLSLLVFSSCEQKTTERHEEHVMNTDSGTATTRTETVTRETNMNEDTTSDFTAEVKRESEEVKMKLERLRERAKKKGGKASEDLNKKIDEWDNERKGFDTDHARNKMKDGWKKFKAKVEAEADSLDKKI